MDNKTMNRLNNLQQNLSRQTDIQNMLNAANLQSQIPVQVATLTVLRMIPVQLKILWISRTRI